MDTHETHPKKKDNAEDEGLNGFYHPLEEAEKLNEAGEGHPLNIMSDLYYESSSEAFHQPETNWKKEQKKQ